MKIKDEISEKFRGGTPLAEIRRKYRNADLQYEAVREYLPEAKKNVGKHGKNCRACSTWINPGDELTIDPAKGFPVIKDLVVDFTDSKQ